MYSYRVNDKICSVGQFDKIILYMQYNLWFKSDTLASGFKRAQNCIINNRYLNKRLIEF